MSAIAVATSRSVEARRIRVLIAACLGAGGGLLVLLTSPGLREPMLVMALVLGAAHDLRTRRVPNWLMAAAAAFAMSSAAATPEVLLGGLAAFAAGLLLVLGARGAYGMGDVKAMGVAGATVGIAGVLPLLFWMALAGGVLVAVVVVRRRGVRGVTVPYAPAIAAGCLLALLVTP